MGENVTGINAGLKYKVVGANIDTNISLGVAHAAGVLALASLAAGALGLKKKRD